MIGRDVVVKERQSILAFLGRQFINASREAAIDEKTLPARDRICTHDGMHCLEVLTDIIGRATVFSQWLILGLGEADKVVAGVRRGQSLEEFLVRWREPVEGSVGAGPQGITTNGRKLADLKGRIVRRFGLESDIRVPTDGRLWPVGEFGLAETELIAEDKVG